jgi:RNA polymerase sigma-70 factor (ECF subfamily)
MAEPADDFRALLQRGRTGDAQALALLTERYEPQVRVVARVLLGPALRPYLDSMDLVQSVHRALLLGLQQAQFEFSSPEKLVHLALKMVRRKAAQHWRKLRRQQRRDTGANPASDWTGLLTSLGSPEPDPARAAQSRDQVEHLLHSLSSEDRQLLELRLDGYRLVEIADRLHAEPGALRMRLLRLRQHLRSGGLLTDWL